MDEELKLVFPLILLLKLVFPLILFFYKWHDAIVLDNQNLYLLCLVFFWFICFFVVFFKESITYLTTKELSILLMHASYPIN